MKTFIEKNTPSKDKPFYVVVTEENKEVLSKWRFPSADTFNPSVGSVIGIANDLTKGHDNSYGCVKYFNRNEITFEQFLELYPECKPENQVLLKFEKGKWYKNIGSYCYIAKFKKIHDNHFYSDGYFIEGGVYKKSTYDGKLTENWKKAEECSLEEIQQYLPKEHPDLIINEKTKELTELPEKWCVVKESNINSKEKEMNTYGLTIGMELPEKAIRAWSVEGLNYYGTNNKWKQTISCFSESRKIEKFDIKDNVLGFFVSGTAGVYLKAEGFLEFCKTFENTQESKSELVFGQYAIGDIVVSAGKTGYRINGDMFKVLDNSSKNNLYYLSDTNSSDSSTWRKATPQEITSYNQGCRNIFKVEQLRNPFYEIKESGWSYMGTNNHLNSIHGLVLDAIENKIYIAGTDYISDVKKNSTLILKSKKKKLTLKNISELKTITNKLIKNK